MKKITGLTRPVHPFQICTYIFFSGCVLIYFLITFPLSSDAERIVGAILEVVFGACVFISGYICTATDTTDTLLQHQKQLKKEGKDISHISSEYHCGHDRAFVLEHSKHCRRCGRCTEGFDHHCKWINNDIGKKNYKSFVTMITSVALFLITFIIFGAIVTARYVKQNDMASYEIWIFSHSKGNILGGLVILWIFMAISSLFFLLDLNLVLFHIFLIRKGLTTFQYITLVEERKEYKKEMEFAMKALGHKRKTRLDFILCLKAKKKLHRGQTASAPISGETRDQGRDSVRKEEQVPLGKIEKDAHNLLVPDEELAGKRTAIDFYSKDNVVTEGNELLGKSPGHTPKLSSLRGLKSEDSQTSPEQRPLTKEDAMNSNKINKLVLNIPDKPTDFKDSENKVYTGFISDKTSNVEELNSQEHINNIKNENYEVDHDHHLHSEEPTMNLKSPEAKAMKIPIQVHINTPAHDPSKNGGVNPQESRHNNYIDVKDSDGKPSFFIKGKLDVVGRQESVHNEMVSRFEAVAQKEGSKINTYKEVEDFIPEGNSATGDQAVEEDHNKVDYIEGDTAVKHFPKKRNSKELEIEVIS